MNAEHIKAALTMVHLTEKSSSNPQGMTRVKAVEHVISNGPKLTIAETDVLRRSRNVSRTELIVQF